MNLDHTTQSRNLSIRFIARLLRGKREKTCNKSKYTYNLKNEDQKHALIDTNTEKIWRNSVYVREIKTKSDPFRKKEANNLHIGFGKGENTYTAPTTKTRTSSGTRRVGGGERALSPDGLGEANQ
jgi:hypothetical protein